jgi:hypothetical protein
VRGFFHRLFVQNAPVKAVSMALAIGLFVLVHYEQAASRELPDLPVRVTGTQRMISDVEPAAVDVVVRGPRTQTDGLRAGEVVVDVDGAGLETLGSGRHVVAPMVLGLPDGVTAVTEPATVTVTLR